MLNSNSARFLVGFLIAFLQTTIAPAQDSIQQFDHDTPLRDLAISPDGRQVLTIDGEGIGRVWNVGSGQVETRSIFVDGGFLAGAFAGDASLALTVPGGVAFVDAETGEGRVLRTKGARAGKPVIAASPISGKILVGGRDGAFDFWTAKPEKHVRTFVTVPDDGMAAVTLDREGHRSLGVWTKGAFHLAEPGRARSSSLAVPDDVVAAGFLGESARFAVATVDGTISVFDGENQQPIHAIEVGGRINDMALSPDGRLAVTAGADGMVGLWHLATGTLVRTYHGHREAVDVVAFARDGKHVLSGGRDENLALLWRVPPETDWHDFAIETALDLDKEDWKAVQGALNGAGANAGVVDGLPGPNTRLAIGRWQKDNNQVVDGYLTPSQFYALTGDVRDVPKIPRFAGDAAIQLGDMLETAGESEAKEDGAAQKPRLDDSPLSRVNGPVGEDLCHLVAASRQTLPEVGSFIAGLSPQLQQTVAVARADNGWYAISVGTVAEAAFNDTRSDLIDRRLIPDDAFCSRWRGYDGFLQPTRYAPFVTDAPTRIHKADERSLLNIFRGHRDDVTSVAFSPDGNSVLTGSEDDLAILWDVETGREIQRFEGHKSGLWSVAFSPDGEMVLTGSDDSTARLWNAATGRKIQSFVGHNYAVISAVLSPDGETVLTGSADNTARLWDVDSGREIRRFEGHGSTIYSVKFSPDGDTVLTGSWDNTARLWDAATGREIRRFEGHDDWVLSVAFSSDGETALTGGGDNIARLWDVATGREIRRLEGHRDDVWSVAFSPDGETVLTGSRNADIRLWDAATGRALQRFEGHEDWVNSVALSPDGKTFITGSRDNTALLWRVPEARWPVADELAEIDHLEEHTSPGRFFEDVQPLDTRHRLVVSEGLTSWQVVKKLGGVEVLDGEVAQVPPEGSLAPSNYEVLPGKTRVGLLERMREVQKTRLANAWEARDEDLPFNSPAELLILASIIEQETSAPEERRTIASVFINRLRLGMRLQVDSTVIYGITNGRGTLGRGLRKSELDEVTPYNTYQVDGLPPTPITNPSEASLMAAADPADTDYLFLVADGSGGYAFAKTLSEHNRNVARWRAVQGGANAKAGTRREERLDLLEAELNAKLAIVATLETRFREAVAKLESARGESPDQTSGQLGARVDAALFNANALHQARAEASSLERRLESARVGRDVQQETQEPGSVVPLEKVSASKSAVEPERCHLLVGSRETRAAAREVYESLTPRLRTTARIGLTEDKHYAILVGVVDNADFKATRDAYATLNLIPQDTACVQADAYSRFLTREAIAPDPLAELPGAHALGAGGGGYRSAAFSPDGAFLLGVDGDGAVTFWDVGSGEVAGTYRPEENGEAAVTAAAFRDAGDGYLNVIAGYADGTIRLLTRQGAPIATLGSVTGAIETLRVGPDQRHVLGVSAASQVFLWDLKSNPRPRQLGEDAPVSEARFSPAGDAILILRRGEEDNTSRMSLWPVTGSGSAWEHERYIALTTARFAPDGQTILAGGSLVRARKFEAATGEEINRFTSGDLGVPQSRETSFVAYSPDGKTVATAGALGGPRVLNAENGRQHLRPYGKPARDVIYTQDARKIVTTHDDGTATITDLDTRRRERFAAADPVLAERKLRALRLSRDGKSVVIRTADGVLHVRQMPEMGAFTKIMPEDSLNEDDGQIGLLSRLEQQRDDVFALVIGNKDYHGNTPDVDFAHNDADGVVRLLRETLAVPSSHVKVRKNLSLTQFNYLFGAAGYPDGFLTRNIPEGTREVIVYYSGHGVPGQSSRAVGSGPGAFLLPTDGSADVPELTAYSLSTLFANLERLPVERVTVILEACFSGLTEAGTLVRNTSGTFGVTTAPPDRPAKVSVLSATAFGERQLAHWNQETKHGAFTWQLLEGLRGGADGNGDDKIMLGELHAFVESGLKQDNWSSGGRTQTPSLQSSDPGHVLADFSKVTEE